MPIQQFLCSLFLFLLKLSKTLLYIILSTLIIGEVSECLTAKISAFFSFISVQFPPLPVNYLEKFRSSSSGAEWDDCGKPFFSFFFHFFHQSLSSSFLQFIKISILIIEMKVGFEKNLHLILSEPWEKSKSLTTYFMQTRFFAWMCFKTDY